MNQSKFVTKEEFLEAAERANLGQSYIDTFLTLEVEVERAGDGPFNFIHAMPLEGIEVYSLECSSPI